MHILDQVNNSAGVSKLIVIPGDNLIKGKFWFNTVIIRIMWCSIDSCDEFSTVIIIYKSHYWSITSWLRVRSWFFTNQGFKICWHCWGFEPATLDLSSQSVAFDHSATTTTYKSSCKLHHLYFKQLFSSPLLWPNGHGILLGIWGSWVESPSGISKQSLTPDCHKSKSSTNM